MKKNILVIYHGDCLDGFTGAYAAWLKFGNRAEYIGAKERSVLPESIKGKEVYVIDWTYNPDHLMHKLKKDSEKLVIIDHHETAFLNTKIADEFLFRNENSGAVLAWEYFWKKKDIPKLFKYIEDMDLWKFKYKETKRVVSYMQNVQMNFPNWHKSVKLAESSRGFKDILLKGEHILKYENKLAEEIAGKAEFVKFAGKKILAANSPVLSSEIGEILYRKQGPFSLVWYKDKDGTTKGSLRSDGGYDVGKLAQKNGGGGHKGSAGFRIAKGMKLPWQEMK